MSTTAVTHRSLPGIDIRGGRGRLLILGAATLATILVVGCWYLLDGDPRISMGTLIRALTGQGSHDTGIYLVRQVRLPRLLLALLAGIALGLAGVVLQYTLRNPIADPGILGLSQASSLVVAVSVLFPGALPHLMLPVACIVAGLGASAILVVLAKSIRDPVRLLLVGVVLASLGATLTSAVIVLLPLDRAVGLGQFFGFTAGTIASASWSQIALVAPWLVVAIPAALLSGRPLNLLQLGDDMAIGRGMRVTRARALLLTCACLLVAPVVAVVGPISFVALLSPHVAKVVLRTSNAHLILPASAMVGAIVLLLADTAGRLLFFPTEIPAGIWTIVVVGPMAVILARRSARHAAPVEGS
ncbi:MAG: FecCD family ABC transporter permease [Marmoricola sp.]